MLEVTEAEIKEVAVKAAKAAVMETLLLMGVDVSKPEAVQEMQADFQQVRKWRKSVETVQRQSLLTAIGIVVSGIIGAIVVTLRGSGH
ncbi:hypothetical protein [Bradyrhizobium cajani]|nr:hypothetical protein [Bradyrhizobium cajani]MCP3368291.1 hypothetical protein [Bradyrhizobium cajani]